MKQGRITRRKWRFYGLSGLLAMCALLVTGCNPYYALQRSLSPLGFAWYGDLLRLRTLHAKMPQRLTKDRWQRAVRVTVLAIKRYARKHKWTPHQERLGLLRFAQKLTKAARDAKEPFARHALTEIFQKWRKHRAMAWPFLYDLLSEDPHPMVRKQAFAALLALQPTTPWLQRATTRALQDQNYWVRSGVLFALLPAMVLDTHPLHNYALEGLSLCTTLDTQPPLDKQQPRPDLLLRLRIHCLRAIAYATKHKRTKAIAFVQTLIHKNNPLSPIAAQTLARLKAPQLRILPAAKR